MFLCVSGTHKSCSLSLVLGWNWEVSHVLSHSIIPPMKTHDPKPWRNKTHSSVQTAYLSVFNLSAPTHIFSPEPNHPVLQCLLHSPLSDTCLWSSQQHLILWLVCPTYFPALNWQTVAGLLKVVGESLDSFHRGYPGGRLIGKVIYCSVSILHSSFSTFLSGSVYASICLQIYTRCLQVKVAVCMCVCIFVCLKQRFPCPRVRFRY